ncbi:hypothetical protein QBC45DRAFT_35294 [Copromyces sp. CBS 386.78]|nr:hypothetical protein QBC45DRAFT_35294 [Copromyces sp. CBS 386.78]
MTWMATDHPTALRPGTTFADQWRPSIPRASVVKLPDLLVLTRRDQPCRQFIYILRRCCLFCYSWIQLGQKNSLIGEGNNHCLAFCHKGIAVGSAIGRRRYVSEALEKRGHQPGSSRKIAKWLTWEGKKTLFQLVGWLSDGNLVLAEKGKGCIGKGMNGLKGITYGVIDDDEEEQDETKMCLFFCVIDTHFLLYSSACWEVSLVAHSTWSGRGALS